jgi:hypothetical protein
MNTTLILILVGIGIFMLVGVWFKIMRKVASLAFLVFVVLLIIYLLNQYNVIQWW